MPSTRLRRARQASAAAPLALLLFFALIPTASAHAVFAASDPAPDSHVQVGLARVQVTLTEDVILDFSGLEVADLQGVDWTEGRVEHAGSANSLSIATRPLTDGLYVISWKALSADTHTTRGSYLIAVGNATLTQASGAIDDTAGNAGGSQRDAAARTAYYLGLILALGMPTFFLWVDRERAAPTGALLAAGGFAIVGSIGGLVNLYGLSARTEVALEAIAFTKGGIYLTLRTLFVLLAGALLLAAAAARGNARRGAMLLAILAALAALASTSLGSHSSAVSEGRSLAIISDGVHLLVASVWLGGVAGFLFAVRGRDSATLARLVARFSPMAMTSVALVIATGVIASVRFVSRWDALVSEPYGRLVLAKILLVVVLVGFGAFHQRVVHRRLHSGAASPRAFRRVIQVEAIVMALVVLAAGALATTSPPQDKAEVSRVPLILELTANSTLTHLVVQVTPYPIVVGVQTIRVYLHPLTAAHVPNSTIVQLKIWHENESEPDVALTPEKSNGTAEWTLRGGHFTRPGAWNVKVLYQRSDEGFERFTFQVPVAAS